MKYLMKNILFLSALLALQTSVLFSENQVCRIPTSAQIKEYKSKAEAGDAKSQLTLAILYSNGHYDLPQNYNEAIKWYRKSASQGIGFAQIGLGLLYMQGRGIPQDPIESYAYFSLASVSSEEGFDGHRSRKDGILLRDRIAEKMTLGQIAAAQMRTKELQEEFERD
jgi:TPR repeat protein